MKGAYLWSLALAAAGTVQGEGKVPDSQQVRTAYDYEVMTSELLYTRTIPRYVTLTNNQGKPTATIVTSSAEVSAGNSTKTSSVPKTTLTYAVPMTVSQVTSTIVETITSCSGNPGCTNGQVVTKVTISTTTCPVTQTGDTTVSATSTQTVHPVPYHTGVPVNYTHPNASVSQNSGVTATSKPILLPTGYPSKPSSHTPVHNISSSTVSQNSGATGSSRPLTPYGTGIVAKPLIPSGSIVPSGGLNVPTYAQGPSSNNTVTSKPSTTSKQASITPRPSYVPSGSGTPPLASYPAPGPYANTTKVPMTTSTVYTTKIGTVTKCPPTVTNCPVGAVTTQTIALYTTICPVSEAQPTPSKIVSTKYEVSTPASGGPAITRTSVITLPYPGATSGSENSGNNGTPYGSPPKGNGGIVSTKIHTSTPAAGGPPITITSVITLPYPGATSVSGNSGNNGTPYGSPPNESSPDLTTVISVSSPPGGVPTTITSIRTATRTKLQTVTDIKTAVIPKPTPGGNPEGGVCPDVPSVTDAGAFPVNGIPYKSGAKITMDGMVYVMPANATGIIKAMGYAPVASVAASSSPARNYTRPGATGTGSLRPYGTGSVRVASTGSLKPYLVDPVRPTGTGTLRPYVTGPARAAGTGAGTPY
ncbi:hypothetical protein HYFRA_00008143 [Hymenoscyphus fraxineus]|uniref:Uncharacterized protein n=1 Tax=Hymenoscyphus fraxineus TaxID=746836 RepID=A0A9N9PN55_9HELO|nr:hypothetical protein HYFRA_00008143 [Hymenoscyphus fraxineus]